MTRRRVVSVLILLAASACSSTNPYASDVAGRDYYLCCNLRFNEDGDATDANYAYPAGTTLAAGTRVRIVEAGGDSVYLFPLNEQRRFSLELRYGTQQQSAAQYFAAILRETDPRTLSEAWPADVQDAVRNSRLLPGMTKEQVLMARGYPPYHRTPGGIESDEWLYYESRGWTTRVRFENGKLVNLQSLTAPQ